MTRLGKAQIAFLEILRDAPRPFTRSNIAAAMAAKGLCSDTGTLYKVIVRLEHLGYVKTYERIRRKADPNLPGDSNRGGTIRTYYELTPEGRDRLKANRTLTAGQARVMIQSIRSTRQPDVDILMRRLNLKTH